MAIVKTPKVGKWYKFSSGQLFRVVAADEDDETIEIQYFDGSLEELDNDSWKEMRPDQTSPPEDLSGLYDEMDEEHIDEQPHTTDDLGWSDHLDDDL